MEKKEVIENWNDNPNILWKYMLRLTYNGNWNEKSSYDANFRKLSVEDNILAILQMTKLSKTQQKERLEELLNEFGLQHVRKNLGNKLSGGEQQRVSIARAFANRPTVMLADEPTGNLDPANSVGIMKLLDLINRRGTTVVMATHDRSIVNSMQRRVIELDRGVVVRDDSHGIYDEPNGVYE